MKKAFYDISMTIRNGMVTWPSDGPVKITRERSMDSGDKLNQSRLEMSAHTGTHIDAPVHFIKGMDGVDLLPLDVLIGPAVVVHVPGAREIGAAELDKAGFSAGMDRVLLKTDNSDLLDSSEFVKEYSYLTPGGAEYLMDSGVKLVGMDYLSVAQYGSGEAVHKALLGAGTVIIEGLYLNRIKPGQYKMTALPLKIAGCDGAPARVVLEELR